MRNTNDNIGGWFRNFPWRLLSTATASYVYFDPVWEHES
jgi:hypothetical protein